MGHVMGATGVCSEAGCRHLPCEPDVLDSSAEDTKQCPVQSVFLSVSRNTVIGRHGQGVCCLLTEKRWSLSIHWRGRMP